MQGYREHTGVRWKEVLRQLEEVNSVRWPDAVVGAVAAFSALRSHFSGRPRAEFDAVTLH
ncbi:MAG: hypothetical protein H7Z19_04360 [Chitinophagaceae bacterium]|nr:hypothetical protein [Rubrivivax sp.]